MMAMGHSKLCLKLIQQHLVGAMGTKLLVMYWSLYTCGVTRETVQHKGMVFSLPKTKYLLKHSIGLNDDIFLQIPAPRNRMQRYLVISR